MIKLDTFSPDVTYKHIALLDNCSITFLQELERRGIETKQLFITYDCVVIPTWIKNEFVNSVQTEQYFQLLLDHGIPIKESNETDFSDLIPSIKSEGLILDLFIASSSLFTQIKTYLYKNVHKDDLLDLEDSHVWIKELYDNWPMTNGAQKKNAGEISLTVLANILSIFYPNLQTITIFTHDKDTYDAQHKASEVLQPLNNDLTLQTPISFKTNDFLLKQLYSKGLIDKSMIESIRDSERTLMYNVIQADGSIVSLKKKISKDEFSNLLDNPDFSIIF